LKNTQHQKKKGSWWSGSSGREVVASVKFKPQDHTKKRAVNIYNVKKTIMADFDFTNNPGKK
jgi:hypothetical protein